MLLAKNSVDSKYERLYSLAGKKIGIPIFQRFYAWKPQQTKQLLIDLEATMDDPSKDLYLLDFIYYEEDGVYKLADGQQRAVTINNLIKAIKDYAYTHSVKIKDIDLFDISYDIQANDRKYKTHFGNSLPYISNDRNSAYPTAPFKKVYEELYRFVMEHKGRLNELISVIKNNIYIYLKKCKDAEDAFYIFQQINTGGKPLSKDDVIKTALDQYSKIYHIDFDTSKMKDVKQSVSSFYKFKNDDPNVNFDNIQIMTFIKDYITKDMRTFLEFTQTVKLLKSLDNNPLKYVIGYINRNTLLDVLGVLAIKNIDTMADRNYVEKLMLPLCMMSAVLTIKGGSPTTFRYLLNNVIEMIKNNENADSLRHFLLTEINNNQQNWVISFEEFKEALGNPAVTRNLKKGLMIIDAINRNTSTWINVASINLEHIYPQHPVDEWAMNAWPASVEEQKPLIDNIGNYLLLAESVNKKIQNEYITDKVNQYRIIIPKDSGLQTEINTVDFERFKNEKDKYIFERQEFIAKQIQTSAPFGPVLIK